MGRSDRAAKRYLGDNEIYADVLNYSVFGGRRVVQPDDLSPLGQEELMPNGARRRRRGNSRVRDLLRRAVFRRCNGTQYVVFGIENQQNVDHSMAARCMLYDALRYDELIREAIRQRREAMQAENGKEKWKLPGFPEGQKVEPVVTVVIYWGREPWNGPRSLHELLDCKDRKIFRMAADYRLNLIEPLAMKPKDYAAFSSELGAVLNYVGLQNDPEALRELLRRDGRFKSLSLEAVELLKAVTGAKIQQKTEDGRVDMCRAQQILMEQERKLGEKRGIKLGEERGEKRGIKLGEERGIKLGEERGEKRGIKLGEERGIVKAIKGMLEASLSAEAIKVSLMAGFSLTSAEALQYMLQNGVSCN